MPSGLLLPDFIIIGRQKCGTTSLAAWLAEQPDVFFSRIKEPTFFDDDAFWERGLRWYASLFRGAADGQLRGEATTSYTHADLAAISAERMARTVPKVKLIYMVRDPTEQIRSTYRHRRMMGDESSTSLEAVLGDADSWYIRNAKFYTCLAPYIERFARGQILVVRMEDLVGTTDDGWTAVLRHLGLPPRPRPQTRRNVSAERGLARSPMRLVRKTEFKQLFWWVPQSVRNLGKTAFSRRGAAFEQMLSESMSPVPSKLLAEVWDDITRLEDWLGLTEPLWPRAPGRPVR